ncbi:hypothetical protein D3C87_1410310 [compost metagenome]
MDEEEAVSDINHLNPFTNVAAAVVIQLLLQDAKEFHCFVRLLRRTECLTDQRVIRRYSRLNVLQFSKAGVPHFHVTLAHVWRQDIIQTYHCGLRILRRVVLPVVIH